MSEPSFALAPVSTIRRNNLLLLLQEFSEQQVRLGQPAKGMEKAFSEHLQISAIRFSQAKNSRPISDILAAQIESHCKKPQGWLSTAHGAPLATPAELAFVALAQSAWRTANAAGKRELMYAAKRGFIAL